MLSARDFQAQQRAYLAQRRSTFEFRCQRYAAVREKLLTLDLKQRDQIMDVGAGSQDFNRYMTMQGWQGLYVPVDGAIDGTDLNVWWPPMASEFFVAIEVLEHLIDPIYMMSMLEAWCVKGVVITTPNSAVVDTLEIDETHISPLYVEDFQKRGWQTEVRSLFCKENDSIVAWYQKK